MNELLQLPIAKLTELNLHVQQGQLRIEWPGDVNLFHMTLGKYLGEADRDRVAILFENSSGVVTTQSFAQVDVAATNLAATLRALGYGRGDLIGLHTGQQTTMTLHPADANHGYKFQRSDLPDSPIIDADVDRVVRRLAHAV